MQTDDAEAFGEDVGELLVAGPVVQPGAELALRTTGALAYYVNGFVLQEQASRHEDRGQPADQLAALAELLDGGASASLLVAIREGGSPLGEEAFEHGLRALIDGTAAALARQRSTDQV